MAADAGFNFNDLSIRMGMGQAKSDGGDSANEKDIFEWLVESIGGGVLGKLSKFTGAPNLEGLPNTGINKQFDSQGLQEKMINPIGQSFSAPGGFLYKILSALLKNSAITDQTHGIEAGAHIAGGDYGDSGGSSGGGGDSGGGSSGGNYGESHISDMGGSHMGGGGPHIEPMTMEYGGRTFEVANMPAEIIGNITPSSGASLSDIRGKGGFEIE